MLQYLGVFIIKHSQRSFSQCYHLLLQQRNLRLVINFTSILQVAFTPIFLHQKCSNKKCKMHCKTFERKNCMLDVGEIDFFSSGCIFVSHLFIFLQHFWGGKNDVTIHQGNQDYWDIFLLQNDVLKVSYHIVRGPSFTAIQYFLVS